MAKRMNQTDRTRNAIVTAAGDMVFGATAPEDFTMQHVADAAGVSHRTLYRYFESRQELINAVGAAYDEQLDTPIGDNVRESFDAWTSSNQRLTDFSALTEQDLMRGVSMSIATGQWRSDRDDAYWKLFRDEFPNLDEVTAREDFAVLRSVLWSVQTVFMRQRFSLTSSQVASAMDRAVPALLEAIRARDKEAAELTKGRGL